MKAKDQRKEFWLPRIWGRKLGFIARHVFIWCALGLVAYWAWIDHNVVRAFDSRHWDLPSRIYSAPLEIYQDLRLSSDDFAEYLRQSGYRRVSEESSYGQYSRRNGDYRIHSRGFTFADGAEASRSARILLKGSVVQSVEDSNSGEPIGVLRLEPLEIGRVHSDLFEDRVLLARENLSQTFVKILMAIEDRRFLSHIGVDWLGILRAASANLRHGRITQGASTLTQQLAKNLYLTRQRTLWRKINEAMMALSLERHYSKDEILETYVNEVFLGQDGNRAIHGFGLAAEYYFGRPLTELSIPEVSLLVGMIRGPSRYNPFRFPERATARRNVVLQALSNVGVVNAPQFRALAATPLGLRQGEWRTGGRYAAFLDLVRRQLKRDYQESDLRTAGLKVFTTLEPIAQSAAEAAVQKIVPTLEVGRPKLKGALQAAVIVTDASTADIKALVGSRTANSQGFNRALDAKRQIGSLIKPFIYLTALERLPAFNVLSRLEDEPRTWHGDNGKAWTPKNYDGRYHGEVSAEDALARSLNLATVDLGYRLGTNALRESLRRLGASVDIPNYPALFLGAVDMSPYDVAQLYQVVAADGFRIPLRAINAVVDSHNQPIKRYGLRVERVIDASSAFLTRYLLTRVVERGTARALIRDFPDSLPLAGKTGTSNDARDSWFVGFSGSDLATVWIGRDDNQSAGLTGATGALRVWSQTMKRLGTTPVSLVPPADVAWHWLTADGNAMTTSGCFGAIRVPVNVNFLPPVAPPCVPGARATPQPGLYVH
ncbi:MAG: penicillin-binding protein 1B [Gammaproteobacteria bacterium]|nr:penicillin-binding protein 1B [Gammaproteobacteria bacterium]